MESPQWSVGVVVRRLRCLALKSLPSSLVVLRKQFIRAIVDATRRCHVRGTSVDSFAASVQSINAGSSVDVSSIRCLKKLKVKD